MQSVIAQYEIDGWFKYEEWKGTNHELHERARQKMREGASRCTLITYGGTTIYHLQGKGIRL